MFDSRLFHKTRNSNGSYANRELCVSVSWGNVSIGVECLWWWNIQNLRQQPFEIPRYHHECGRRSIRFVGWRRQGIPHLEGWCLCRIFGKDGLSYQGGIPISIEYEYGVFSSWVEKADAYTSFVTRIRNP